MDVRLPDGFRDPTLASNLLKRINQSAAALADAMAATKQHDMATAGTLPASGRPSIAAAGQVAGQAAGQLDMAAAGTMAASGQLDMPAAGQVAGQLKLQLMEVCGTHTMAIAKSGLRELLPDNIRLLSGPGCPVCVTANQDIDRIIALTRIPNVMVTTFGDMLRVPGSSTSLAKRRAEGAKVEVVYSPLDALKLAEDQPAKQVVFVGVGFETTAPLIAATVLRAKAAGVSNFSVLSAFKLVPPALRALLDDPELALDGLILPGHVSTILGLEAYRFVAEQYAMPAVVTGFEPLDILAGISMLLEQLLAKQRGGSLAIGNAYTRSVQLGGNPAAQKSIAAVFQPIDADWRGLGSIPNSGLAIKPEYAAFDALKRFDIEVEPTVEPRGCRCGDILRGIALPNDCPHFGRTCTPAKPLGACMVSSEGSCAAYYRYNISGNSTSSSIGGASVGDSDAGRR